MHLRLAVSKKRRLWSIVHLVGRAADPVKLPGLHTPCLLLLLLLLWSYSDDYHLINISISIRVRSFDHLAAQRIMIRSAMHFARQLTNQAAKHLT